MLSNRYSSKAFEKDSHYRNPSSYGIKDLQCEAIHLLPVSWSVFGFLNHIGVGVIHRSKMPVSCPRATKSYEAKKVCACKHTEWNQNKCTRSIHGIAYKWRKIQYQVSVNMMHMHNHITSHKTKWHMVLKLLIHPAGILKRISHGEAPDTKFF
jgi:hypothetical protein